MLMQLIKGIFKHISEQQEEVAFIREGEQVLAVTTDRCNIHDTEFCLLTAKIEGKYYQPAGK